MSTTPQTPIQQISADKIPEWAKDPTKLPIKFQPCADRIVVFPDPPRTRTTGGLIIDDNSKGKIEPTGTVLAVGPGKWSEYSGTRIPMEIQVGKRIIFGMYAGDDYLLDLSGHLIPYATVGRITTNHILVKVLRQDAVLATL